jgi:hypothetical protein
MTVRDEAAAELVAGPRGIVLATAAVSAPVPIRIVSEVSPATT